MPIKNDLFMFINRNKINTTVYTLYFSDLIYKTILEYDYVVTFVSFLNFNQDSINSASPLNYYHYI